MLTYTTTGIVALFCWLLLGEFAFSMRDRSVGPLAQWYLSQLNVPNLVFGILLSSVPAFLGIIIVPIISVKSDRYRGKWGRRIPFLLVTTPLAALGVIGVALTPLVAREVHHYFPDKSEMFVSVACFAVFWTAFEVVAVAGAPLFGGLINDVVPRELLGRFYGLFRAVSLIDGMVFNYWIFGKVPQHFTLILGCIGIFYGIALLWVCIKVKEGNYPPPEVPAMAVASQPAHGVAGFIGETKRYFRECFSNPYYIAVFLMLLLAGMAFVPINMFAYPYARSLGINVDVYGKFVALTYTISLCGAYFLGWLVDLLHPLRMALGTLALYLFAVLWGFFFAHSSSTFLIAWVAHGVLSGCYLTSAASLSQRLFPRSKFAQFASAAGMCASLGNMALAPLMGLVIDRSGGIYHHTFLVACTLSSLALLLGAYVYVNFMKLGGPKEYVAP